MHLTAEEYYRVMMRGDAMSWNVRDKHSECRTPHQTT
jgi:hypothetical protein